MSIKKEYIFLIILLIILLIMYFSWPKFNAFIVKNSVDKKVSSFLGGGKNQFIIEPLSSEDILFDRFMVNNLGKINLTEYTVKIDDKIVEVYFNKQIKSGEKNYLYLVDYYPTGNHNLSITSNRYTYSLGFYAPEDLHVVKLNVN